MKFFYAFLFFVVCSIPCHAQTGNACSSNTAAATGSPQSYAFCTPTVIDGRNKGGWIALNRTGDQSNSETQCYSPMNVFIQNGILTEVVRSLTSTCHYFPAQTGVGTETNSFSSAFVQWNTFSYTFGDLIIRMKGPGNIASSNGWPALWLLGANCEFSSKVTADNTTFNGLTCNWPNSGSEEIDVYEAVTTTSSTCNLFSGGGNVSNTYTITDPSLAFHLYELRWSSGSLQWYYDGVHQTGCDISGANVPSTPMFLQMNVAMHPGATGANLPTNMQIDWVKVCQPSPCSGNGGNIIFYDDFVTGVATNITSPKSKLARLASTANVQTSAPSVMFANLTRKHSEEILCRQIEGYCDDHTRR